jgi:hypothetical protein
MDVWSRRWRGGSCRKSSAGFQADVCHLDRILIARYDDTGGYFRRHRDDAAAHISYRQFAVSLNLNTHEYEGGNVMFPEFSDDHYSPPAGGAAVFSASLLHEANAGDARPALCAADIHAQRRSRSTAALGI